MKRFASIAVSCVLLASTTVFGTDYYTRASGSWTSNIWGTSTTGTGGAFPTNLQDGDVFHIDDDVVLIGSFPIGVRVTIIVSATLRFSEPPPAQLSLPADSEVLLYPGGQLIPEGNGNSNFITIGGNKVYEGKKTGEIEGPGTIDDGGWQPGVLPVKLMYFNLSRQGSAILVSWATSMEENFQRFIVQRADDGLHFVDIGEVKGSGFDIHNIESQYTFIDDNPLLGFNYYRLKAVDLDDTFEYFDVKAVRMDAAKKLAVYPNPTTGESISFRTNFNAQEADRIAIIDQLGVEVFNGPATGSINSITFPNTLRAGIYMLRYTSGDFEQTQRIIVKN